MTEFNKLIPELTVTSLARSLDFYVRLIGFEVRYERPEDKFAFLEYEGSQVMLEEGNDLGSWSTGKLEYPFGRGINFQIEVGDAQKIFAKLTAAKYPIKIPVKDSWYREGRTLHGERQFLVMDPDGYLLRFAQPIGTKTEDERS